MQTEQEFLKSYNIKDYDRPSLTADIVAFMVRSEEDGAKKDQYSKLCVLLIKRGGHPYKDQWALPGGFFQPGETLEECALREIKEETNVTPASLMPVGIFSDPGRDPRGWIVSGAYASIISEESVKQAGGDDASDAQWFDIGFYRENDGKYRLDLKYKDTKLCAALEETETKFGKTSFKIIDRGELAFDHAKIIASALTALRESAKSFDAIFDFLPEKFTLTQLQRVQETVMNISVLPANFRRKITDYVVETDEYTRGESHRPAKLYRKKQ